MAKRVTGPEIERLIELLSRLPGLGPRSGRKAALALIKRRQELLQPLAQALANAAQKLSTCSSCGNVDTLNPCSICQDTTRDGSLIVVVEEVGDLWALERAQAVNARYHVLGGHLSPLDGIGPAELNIKSLLTRLADGEVKELLLALNATVEGHATSYYLVEELKAAGVSVRVSRLAQGIPIGGELDYLDEGTLSAAIKARKSM